MSIHLKYIPHAKKRLLVEFSHGSLNDGSEVTCHLYQEKQQLHPKRKCRKMMVLNGSHLQYVGDNYKEREAHPGGRQFLVAEINKSTGVAQVYETDHFRLQPVLTDSTNSDEEVAAAKKGTEKPFYERNDDLTTVFGSYRQKRAMVSRLRNKVADSATAVQNTVEALLQQPDFLTADEDADHQQSMMLIPYNVNAQNASDVYSLAELIPAEVSQSLVSEAQQFKVQDPNTIENWKGQGNAFSSAFIIEHLTNPGTTRRQNDELYTDFACCLQLMIHFIRIFKIKSAEFRKRNALSDLNETLRQWVFSEFFLSSTKSRTMPTRMKDKVLAYAVVLAWHIDSFRTNATWMQDAFGISRKRFSSVVRVLGGTLKTVTESGVKREIAVLSLPLQFPTISMKRSRH